MTKKKTPEESPPEDTKKTLSDEEWANRIKQEKAKEAPKNDGEIAENSADVPPKTDPVGTCPSPPEIDEELASKDEAASPEIEEEDELSQMAGKTTKAIEENDNGKRPNDVSDFTCIPTGPVTETVAAMTEKVADLSQEQVNELVNSGDKSMQQFINIFQAWNQLDTQQRHFVHKLASDDKTNLQQPSEQIVNKILHKSPTRGEVEGRHAELLFMAHVGGIRRLPLPNSGFNVSLRPFSILELQSFYTSVDISNRSLGHSIGCAFYHILDCELKKQFMKFFVAAVEDSNLEGWSEKGTLLKSITLADYDLCLWAVCTLMYPKGIETSLYCANMDCQYEQKNKLIDLETMLLYNINTVSEKDLVEQLNKTKVTVDELEEWRQRPEFTKKERFTLSNDSILEYEFCVPTMQSYIEASDWLIGELKALVNGEFNVMSPVHHDLLVSSIYRSFLAWIKSVASIDEETGEVTMITHSRKAIQNTLDPVLHGNTPFNEKFHAFVQQIKLTYIGYTGIKCPACGQEVSPDVGVNDFIPLDCHLHFFDLACRKFQAAG